MLISFAVPSQPPGSSMTGRATAPHGGRRSAHRSGGAWPLARWGPAGQEAVLRHP